MINIRALKNISLLKKYERGADVPSASTLVVVLKGEVGLFRNRRQQNEARIASVGPGECYGEAGFFLEKDTPIAAVALSDVIALPVARNDAVGFIREEPEMALEIMKAICGRLEAAGGVHERLNGRPLSEPKPLSQKAPAAQGGRPPEGKPPARGIEPPLAPAPAPAAQASAQDQGPGAGFALFPEGHGSYQLALHNEDRVNLLEKSYACPYCKTEFKALKVKASRLMLEGTDSDMRSRYKGIEPIYYDVVTCPNCLYSALGEMFGSPEILKADLKELQALKAGAGIRTGVQMDAHSVFAGYYLALLCAPKCFTSPALATAKLLLKLSRIYQDCGEGRLEEQTAKRALEAYMHLYLNGDGDPGQDQQLCIILGELYLKQNDLRNARDFFFKAKTNREGTPLLKTHAETRIGEIREREGKG